MGAPFYQKSINQFLINFREHIRNFPSEIPSYSEIYDSIGDIVAQSVNAVEIDHNPLHHSEWIVIEKSLQIKKEKYLNDTILITALEPCIHCTGSIIKSRIRDVLYFLPSKSGDGISSLSIEMIYQLNHFPNLYLIPNEEIFSKFKTFFLDKR